MARADNHDIKHSEAGHCFEVSGLKSKNSCEFSYLFLIHVFLTLKTKIPLKFPSKSDVPRCFKYFSTARSRVNTALRNES